MDDGKYGEGTEGAAVQRLSTDGAAAEEARETVCSSVESCAALLGCAKLARVTYPSDRYDTTWTIQPIRGHVCGGQSSCPARGDHIAIKETRERSRHAPSPLRSSTFAAFCLSSPSNTCVPVHPAANQCKSCLPTVLASGRAVQIVRAGERSCELTSYNWQCVAAASRQPATPPHRHTVCRLCML